MGRQTVRQARRRLSAEERRNEIIQTAADLFDRAGYSSTTMEDIAGTLGIAKPTLYHYFSSKEEILYWIHEEFITLIIERHKQRLQAGLDPRQLLLEVMADILELMETHRGHVRVFFEHHRELPEVHRNTIKLKRDQYEQMVVDVFTSGIASGDFRQTDPHLAALAMFGMVNWAYQWYRAGGPMRTREIAYVFWGYLVRGVGPERHCLMPGCPVSAIHDRPKAGATPASEGREIAPEASRGGRQRRS